MIAISVKLHLDRSLFFWQFNPIIFFKPQGSYSDSITKIGLLIKGIKYCDNKHFQGSSL